MLQNDFNTLGLNNSTLILKVFMRLLFILLLIGNFVFAQKNNCCDSIILSKKSKSISHKTANFSQPNINISIDNSPQPINQNTPCPIQVTTKEICCDDKPAWFDIMTNCIGAFFGFTLSILIFIAEQRLQRKKELKLKKEKDLSLLKYYSELIKNNIGNAKKNLELLWAFIDIQSKDLTSLQVLKRKPSHDFTRLITIDNKGVFDAWISTFENNDKIIQYRRTNSAIDNIDGIIREVHRMHEKVIGDGINDLLKVKNIIDAIPTTLTVICYELEKELGQWLYENDNFKKLNNFIKIYRALVSEAAPISKFLESFITPLLYYVNENYRDKLYSNELLVACQNSRRILNDVKNDIQNLLEEYKKIDGPISESFKVLETTITRIDSLKNY